MSSNTSPTYEDVARQRQAHFIFGLSVISVVGLIIYATIAYLSKQYPDILFVGFLIIFYTTVANVARRDKVELATAMLGLVGAIGLYYRGYGDASGNSGLLLFNIYPILVFFLMGKLRGILWTLGFIAVCGVAYLLSLEGIIHLSYSTTTLRDFIFAFAVTTVVVYFYQDLMDASVKIIEKRDEQLAIERDQANAIVTSIGDGVIVVDKDHRIVSINPAGEHLLATTTQEAIGEDIVTIFPLMRRNQSLPPVEHPATQTITTSQVTTINQEDGFYYITKIGRQTPVTIVASPVSYQDKTTSAVIVFRDITADKTAALTIENEVRQRTHEVEEGRARLLASINSLDLGYIMTNFEPEIVMINNAATALLSKIGASLPQGSTSISSFSAIQQKLGRTVDIVTEIRKSMADEHVITLPDLQYDNLYVQIFISPIIFDQEVIGSVILLQDITEAKIVARSKDEFFTIASHELRTPLSIIRGNVDLIQTIYKEHLKDAGFAKKISYIHDSCIRLIRIVNDFLTLSRLEQGAAIFNLEPLALPELIRFVENEFGVMAKAKQLTLSLVASTSPPSLVLADPERVKQVITNLVGNAIKFTVHGGVTLAVEPGAVGFMKVSVTDTGSGIAPKNQALLFRKFQQAGDSILSRDASGGTGLGLYISKLIIERMGGEIRLENSTIDRGSIFSFTLPIASPRQIQSHIKRVVVTSQPSHLARPTDSILIVDDDPQLTELYQAILTHNGYRVSVARNGQEGLAEARKAHFSLILLDVMMPDLNGIDVLKQLKAAPETQSIPVIMLSNVADPEYHRSALLYGATDYIVKTNVSSQELTSLIARVRQ